MGQFTQVPVVSSKYLPAAHKANKVKWTPSFRIEASDVKAKQIPSFGDAAWISVAEVGHAVTLYPSVIGVTVDDRVIDETVIAVLSRDL